MKEPYETPKMVSEKVDTIGTLNASSANPQAVLEPNFGLCPPCP